MKWKVKEVSVLVWRSLTNGGRIFRLLSLPGFVLACLGTCWVVGIIGVSALTRYTKIAGVPWVVTDEAICFFVLFIVIMSMGFIFAEERHIRITAFFRLLPSRTQNIVQMVSSLLALFYVAYLGYATTKLAMFSLRLGSTTVQGGIPLFPMQVCLPIGLFMLFVPVLGFSIKMICIVVRGSKGRERSVGNSLPIVG